MRMNKELSYLKTLLRDNIEELGGATTASPEAVDAAIVRSSMMLEILENSSEKKGLLRHCIVVKFKERGWEMELPAIQSLFRQVLLLPGVHDVSFFENAVKRPNRYDLMIQIEMEENALERYDGCKAHQEWKEKYGGMLESKAIFDMTV